MLTHQDMEAMENLPTCIQMPPASPQQCEDPNKWFKHNNKLRNMNSNYKQYCICGRYALSAPEKNESRELQL